jgi:uncharacterized membrane protein
MADPRAQAVEGGRRPWLARRERTLFQAIQTGLLPWLAGHERILLLAVLVGAGLFRIGLAVRPGLWGDEVFSLATATGHSLEHPAAQADTALGDYVEAPDPLPPAAYRRYLEHDDPPAGPDRVVRAVLLSDTNPPLYYLLLNAWTRALGTGDAALRLFSVLWALACVPLLWMVGQRVGGPRTAWWAMALYAIAPASVYYATEGRMYSLVWLPGLALAWATLELQRRGPRPAPLAVWIGSGAAGLLTHYFFGLVWLACASWLLAIPGKARRGTVIAAALATGLAVAPWYAHLPESFGGWRVTGNWLAGRAPWHEAALAPLILVWSVLSGHGPWGGSFWADALTFALFAALGLVLWRRKVARDLLARTSLLWLWVLAVCLGPSLLDLLRNSSSALISRYALPALPAGILLAAAGMSRLRPRESAAFAGLVSLTYLPAAWDMVAHQPRPWAPYRETARVIANWSDPADLVVVHSVPSGVLAFARYAREDTPIASWVIQLGRRRVPDDLERWLAGRRGVALLAIHHLDLPSPAEAWLRDNARLLRERHWPGAADVYYFGPAHGAVFPPAVAVEGGSSRSAGEGARSRR